MKNQIIQCKACGNGIAKSAKVCPHCGFKNKKPFYTKWWFWLIVVFFVLGIIGSNGNETGAASDPGESQTAAVTTAATTKATTAATTKATIEYVAELTNGNYTVGIDFPAGVYDIEAIEGNGNVSSSNMYSGGLNMMMGVGDPDMYEESFQNAKLPNGVVLKISNGVTVRISCEAADGAPLAKREQPNTETVTLKNGNYIAGEDFPAGVYDIVVVEGNGNVSSDNMYDGGLNAIMGVGDEIFDDLYEQEYKNIELPKGVTLTVKEVKINLIPST